MFLSSNAVTVRCRHSIGINILLLLILCVPVASYSQGQNLGGDAVHKVQLVFTPSSNQWLGSFAANRIPLREVLSSVFVSQITTGDQGSLSTRLNGDLQDFVSSCKSKGGHALVNETISISVGEVLLGVGSAAKYGFVLTLAGDCVTESKPVTK
jgi:hypothetical protein